QTNVSNKYNGILSLNKQPKFIENPLTFPPPEVVARGLEAIQVFLRSAREQVPQWSSKVLLVGAGGVGKTTLLEVLRSESRRGILGRIVRLWSRLKLFFKTRVERLGEPSTYGINIGALRLPHVDDSAQDMTLHAWDFGGQHIYYATHQFFLTRRSLYLL